jgi:hypothetical protein
MAITVAGAVAGAVVMIRFAAPPGTPSEYSGPRPEPAAEGYIAHQESVVVDVPAARLRTVLDGLDLSNVIEQTADLPRVARTHPLRGRWDPGSDRTGDRRRVELSDGHTLAEEVLVDTDDTFRYMIWGFTTSPQRFAVAHAIGEFRYEPMGEQTRLFWTYSFLPSVGLVRPFVQNFVDGPWTSMMTATIAGMREAAERCTSAGTC